MSGLLNWALEGLHRLWKNKRFSYNSSTKETQQKWIRKSNSLEGFLLESCEVCEDGEIEKDLFRRAYETYCSKNKLSVVSDVIIKNTLNSKGVLAHRESAGDRKRVWKNIKLTESVQPVQDGQPIFTPKKKIILDIGQKRLDSLAGLDKKFCQAIPEEYILHF